MLIETISPATSTSAPAKWCQGIHFQKPILKKQKTETKSKGEKQKQRYSLRQ